MMTGYGSIESAVECMRSGAFDYLIKPFAIDEIEVLLKKAASYNQLVKVNQFLSNETRETSDLIGSGPSMKRLKGMIRKVAATEATVLITGETGTGKEMVARELYRMSPLASQPYIRVNCAAISENLIESEFFGHEKGAFTGAAQRREGRFELANNGTILLDEIGEISPAVQVKLLRVLQEREFERVGGNKTIQVNVRVLATTNRDLLQAVRKGEFREDLYYRLNVFPIHVPALRERPEDIPLLADQFLSRFARKHRLNLPGFTRDAMEMLINHAWPGNVRELQNTIERAVILADDKKPVPAAYLGLMPAKPAPMRPVSSPAQILEAAIASGNTRTPFSNDYAAHFDDEEADQEDEDETDEDATDDEEAMSDISRAVNSVHRVHEGMPSSSAASGDLKTLEDVEKEHILAALRSAGGNRTKTAEVLNVNIRTLRNKLRKYADEGADIMAGAGS
ncbi:MAG: sigma-54-dependent transcriptional regulator [Verrucomicrobiota bacterium]